MRSLVISCFVWLSSVGLRPRRLVFCSSSLGACSVVSSSSIHSWQNGLVLLLNLARWSFRLLRPVLSLNRILMFF
ncbi:hypothetical protein OUZ56_024377 [Daphnia magna]|uniref:Secreted protein n=1 Tax=Daphnia magna TaxID=35525 RepID=A0ABR0B0P8_9CRUS|nr:hypothetical protein OUZ56_024377 [Daphnia magna]